MIKTLAALMMIVTVCQAADQGIDSLTNELRKLPAPEHPIPLRPTSQKERPLPNGRVLPRQELEWRGLYATDPLQKRAAQRLSPVTVTPEQLQDLVAKVDKATQASELPPVELLQDPRAIPALRRALARMSDRVDRYLVLQALYKTGDWNHSADLLQLFNTTTEDHAALQLLGTYHPEIAIPMSLEVTGLTQRSYVAKEKQMSGALVELAFEILEQDKYPGYKQALVSYFKNWPAPIVAGKLADYKVAEAESLIRDAAANADSSAYFKTFTCQKFYHYALARFGDSDSLKWMLAQTNVLFGAPNPKENFSGYLKSQDQYGDLAAFYYLLIKLQTKEAADAYTKLLVKETRQGVHSISANGLTLTTDSLAVDALVQYFAQTGELEKNWDLTEPKRILALYVADPKGAALMKEYIPDAEARADLIAVAQEFGPEGLVPQPAFSSFHRPLQ